MKLCVAEKNDQAKKLVAPYEYEDPNTYANDSSFDDMIRSTADESLADIWIRRSIIDYTKIGSLTEIALKEALVLIKSKRTARLKNKVVD